MPSSSSTTSGLFSVSFQFSGQNKPLDCFFAQYSILYLSNPDKSTRYVETVCFWHHQYYFLLLNTDLFNSMFALEKPVNQVGTVDFQAKTICLFNNLNAYLLRMSQAFLPIPQTPAPIPIARSFRL